VKFKSLTLYQFSMALVRNQKVGNQPSPLPQDVETALNTIVSGGIKTLEEVMNDNLVAIIRNYDGGFSDEIGMEITIAKTIPASLVDSVVPTIVKDGTKYEGREAMVLVETKKANATEVKMEKSKLMTEPSYIPLLRIDKYRCECGCKWQVFRFSVPQVGLRAPLPHETYDLHPDSGTLVYSNIGMPLGNQIRKFEVGKYKILSLVGKEEAVNKLLQYASSEWLKNTKECMLAENPLKE